VGAKMTVRVSAHGVVNILVSRCTVAAMIIHMQMGTTALVSPSTQDLINIIVSQRLQHLHQHPHQHPLQHQLQHQQKDLNVIKHVAK
jgi:hypothetical protein